MPFSRQRSIAAQVRRALGLLALLFMVAAFGMLALARRAAQQADQVYQDHLQPMQHLMQVSEAFSVDITISFRMVRAGRLSSEEGLLRLRQGEQKARQNWNAYRANRRPTAAIQDAEQALARLDGVARRMAAMLPDGRSEELGVFGDHQWLPEVLRCSQSLERLRVEEERQAESTIRALKQSTQQTTLAGAVLMVAALVTALALGQRFTGRIEAGVGRLVVHLRRVADGDLSPAPVAAGEGELALAERELNRTVFHLQQLMKENEDQRALEQAILDGTHALVIGLDLEGRVTRWNRAAEAVLGYPAEAVVGIATPLLWRVPEELEAMAATVSERLGRVLAPGMEVIQAAATLPGFTQECHFLSRAGERVPVLLSISQVRSEHGELLGTMGVALDLRDLHRLKEALAASEARYRLLAERLPGVVYQFQVWPGGRYAWPFISPAFERFYGRDPGVLDEAPLYTLQKLHPEDAPKLQETAEAAARTGGSVDWEGRTFTERPGEMKWIRVRQGPTRMEDGSVLWDGLMEDITALKASQEALRLSEARAQEASRAKSAFLASMSHELRTPLSAILGYSRLMSRDLGRSEEDRVQLDHVLKAGEHLLSLINDVLSLSKIEAGRMELRTAVFAPKDLVKELEALFRLSAQSKGLAFEVIDEGLPALVEGDLPKVRQVLVNLLGNALKFTARGRVRLSVTWRQGVGAFRVEDTGPGISEAEQALIFSAFHQTALGHALGGTGLGLHISQALVALQGGALRIDSQVGVGSRFSFEIPLPEPEGPVVAPSRGAVVRLAQGSAARHLLVVDDRLENRDLLDRLLRQVGFRCSLAEHGAAGLTQWEQGRPDLVLMDLRMPVMDGFEAVRRLREEEQRLGRPRTPVVAISASVFDVREEDLVRLGFDAFLTKPIDEDQLFEVFETLLGVTFERREVAVVAPATQELARLEDVWPAWRKRFRDLVAVGDLEAAEGLVSELPDEALARAVLAALRSYNLQDLLQHLR